MSENINKSISKQVIILAIPIIFSNLSRVAMGLADMAMVSRLGATALAATGMGSVLLWVFLNMGVGIRTSVQTVSSRRLGQKKAASTSRLYKGKAFRPVEPSGPRVDVFDPTEFNRETSRRETVRKQAAAAERQNAKSSRTGR